MTEELEQLLKNLKLRRILEIYDEQLRAADKDDISYSDFVTRLVRAQCQAKQGCPTCDAWARGIAIAPCERQRNDAVIDLGPDHYVRLAAVARLIELLTA